jgi:hypothetical protein
VRISAEGQGKEPAVPCLPACKAFNPIAPYCTLGLRGKKGAQDEREAFWSAERQFRFGLEKLASGKNPLLP